MPPENVPQFSGTKTYWSRNITIRATGRRIIYGPGLTRLMLPGITGPLAPALLAAGANSSPVAVHE
jgi:hypothetical protein